MVDTSWHDWVGVGLVWLKVALRVWPLWLGLAIGFTIRHLWRKRFGPG